MSAFSRTFALAIVMLSLFSAPASAALTLCNRTSYILYVATATETTGIGTKDASAVIGISTGVFTLK